MSLTVNGTLIPEDTANALTVNGTDITEVWANGVSVWKQQLFAAQWSGSSLSYNGIVTSGSSFRWYSGPYNDNYGNWCYANIDGTFQNGSSLDVGTTTMGFYTGGAGSSLANSIQMYQSYVAYPAGYGVLFNIGVGFTGSHLRDVYGNTDGIDTSGGLLRWYRSDDTPGPWISLT